MIANILVLALPVFGLLIIIIHLIAFDVNRLSRDILEAECMWPRVGWTGRCEIGLEETRRTEEVDRTVQMSSHCRWPRQRGKQETDKLLSWFRRWLEIRTKSLFASRLLGMELLYYNEITAPEELESVSFPKPLRTWRVLLM